MANIIDDIGTQIQDFLLLLTQKERYVVERRFNLDSQERATLEEIGQHFSVTRERIRQIEKNALGKLKRNLENCRLIEISNIANEEIIAAGGIVREDFLLSRILARQSEIPVESMQLILSIDRRFVRVPNTVLFHPYLKLAEINQLQIESICRRTYDFLSKSKETASLENLYREIGRLEKLSIEMKTFASLIQTDKKIKYVSENVIGLYEWRHINPRTLRDKIFYVLRDRKQPMHFVEIANKIIEFNFDRKKINLQAVHNELIRHDGFILIGRGIYGLKEWGYRSGTVAEVIVSILEEKGSLSQDQIIEEVMKQRQVKPITIILSLKNKENFVRVGRKQYALKSLKS